MSETDEPAKPREVVSVDELSRQILHIRGEYVLISQQLARLYGVEVRALTQTVKRNPNFFPENSIFQLTAIEFLDIESQIATPYWGGIRRALPYAFTLDAIIPLQHLLKKHGSDELNFDIVRAFKGKGHYQGAGAGEVIPAA